MKRRDATPATPTGLSCANSSAIVQEWRASSAPISSSWRRERGPFDMALPPESLRFVRTALEALQRSGCESHAVLSLGYPDILASSTQLTDLFGAGLTRALEYRPDSESIARWHGLPGGTHIPDSDQFFALLGYDLGV